MLARWLTLMCVICLVSGCPAVRKNIPPQLIEPQQLHPVTQVRPVPAFTQVYIQGPFNVRLKTNKHQKPSLKLYGDNVDLTHIQTYVKQGVLYVSVGPKKGHIGKHRLRMGQVKLDINVPHLHGFVYRGEGDITAHNIHASPLNLWIMNSKQSTWDGSINLRRLVVSGSGTTKITGIHSEDLRVTLVGSPKVELKGKANLRRLNMDGKGELSFHWVKSTDLIVRLAGASRLMLAGTVNRLDGVFSGKSHFDGRYLRVKEAFVKTNDEAVSDIAVVDIQHTLARDKSDIYYYNLPLFRSDFMARNGAVLDMRPEDLILLQNDTAYDH
ncbi:MAG: DUF2807 domain-containing protein [Gammaproteobacteria bacterium]|nr:DUF2807 domain-containing protein [Gammaproteobacteria bacterium]